MTLVHASAWLMASFAGLFSGGILIVAVERLNLWRRMPVDQYVVDFRRSLYRLDPLMPILGMKRIGTPDDVAPAVLFFAGDGAGYITGQTLSASGGLTMA